LEKLKVNTDPGYLVPVIVKVFDVSVVKVFAAVRS